MTDREFALIVYSALKSIVDAMAKKWGFGPYKGPAKTNALPPEISTFTHVFEQKDGEIVK